MTLHRIDQERLYNYRGRIYELSKEVVQAHYQGQETYRGESYFYVFCDFDWSDLFHKGLFLFVFIRVRCIWKKERLD